MELLREKLPEEEAKVELEKKLPEEPVPEDMVPEETEKLSEEVSEEKVPAETEKLPEKVSEPEKVPEEVQTARPVVGKAVELAAETQQPKADDETQEVKGIPDKENAEEATVGLGAAAMVCVKEIQESLAAMMQTAAAMDKQLALFKARTGASSRHS